MRLSVRHKLAFTFPDPQRNVTRILRLSPRSHEGQHVVGWQIDVDTDCMLKAGEDGFGNLTHSFTARGPVESLVITVTGEVDNFDAAGVVRGSAERMPVELFLRETALTALDEPLRDFARATAPATGNVLETLHALMEALHATVAFDAGRADASSAAEAFAAKAANARDMAHLFAGCARHLQIPTRVSNGYHFSEGEGRAFLHTWCEAFVERLGWTGFDAALDLCPQERHIRLATALDVLGALPVRGVGDETVADELEIRAPFPRSWGQSQSQGPGWQRQSQG